MQEIKEYCFPVYESNHDEGFDPIIFGYAVSAYFKELWENIKAHLMNFGVEERNGFGDLMSKLDQADNKEEILVAINQVYENGPDVAMADSDKGIHKSSCSFGRYY